MIRVFSFTTVEPRRPSRVQRKRKSEGEQSVLAQTESFNILSELSFMKKSIETQRILAHVLFNTIISEWYPSYNTVIWLTLTENLGNNLKYPTDLSFIVRLLIFYLSTSFLLCPSSKLLSDTDKRELLFSEEGAIKRRVALTNSCKRVYLSAAWVVIKSSRVVQP